MDNINQERKSQEYDSGSLWEHLLYGAGGVAVMLLPLLFPGISNRTWILGFFGSVMVFYIIVCLLGIWKGLMK
jgi:hypothetical protein